MDFKSRFFKSINFKINGFQIKQTKWLYKIFIVILVLQIEVLGGILVIFRFQGTFGHFLGFKSISVSFQLLGALWSFFRFHGQSLKPIIALSLSLSLDDNRSHSQDQSTSCSNSFNIDTQHLASSKDILFLLNYVIFVKLSYFEFELKCMHFFQSVKNLFLDECYIFVELYYFESVLKA